eukprot:TRINITY_DN8446_c0_g1_i1.p1 TRINITY_DN8446_c0_g1~~TRINITY_DN8446_c0_g1_i1.p1  ORF type:complete len:661 (-),score=96.82 TRINITY_DN8446_c0_g1_i1:141-2093(-)
MATRRLMATPVRGASSSCTITTSARNRQPFRSMRSFTTEGGSAVQGNSAHWKRMSASVAVAVVAGGTVAWCVGVVYSTDDGQSGRHLSRWYSPILPDYYVHAQDNNTADVKPVAAPSQLVEKAETAPVPQVLADTSPRGPNDKPRVVILGSGWAALSLLRELDTSQFEVTLVSPRNYFLFTPLLPSVTVGTLEPRSVVEQVRKFCHRTSKERSVQYFEAACKNINPARKTITCVDESAVVGAVSTFELAYDHLVIAVGAQNTTFGTPGVNENCMFLKELPDALAIRHKVIDLLETANYPGQPDEEVKKLLSFAIVGGGPTGVEFAAELHDFLQDDLKQYYPEDLLNRMTITVVQSADAILNTYDAHISKYAMESFARQGIQVKTGARVTEVKPNEITMTDKKSNKSVKLPFGLCVWAAGVGPVPLVRQFMSALPPETQRNNRAITTDEFLRVKGAENVYAIGDCSTIEQHKLLAKFADLFDETDVNRDGELTFGEFSAMVHKNKTRYPQLAVYASRLEELFRRGDTNQDNKMDKDEFKNLLSTVDRELMPLPCTAQVAQQQGKYLAKAFNNKTTANPAKPFHYHHLGSFAYIGGSASVLELPGQWSFGGMLTWWAWRTTYLSKQISWRNKCMVATDWAASSVFGRDISRV